MIVSTPALAERLAQLEAGVLVVPNALDERLFGSPPEPRRPAFVHGDDRLHGNAHARGGPAHGPRAAPALLRRHGGRVRLELVGGAEGQRLGVALRGPAVPRSAPAARGHVPEVRAVDAPAPELGRRIAPLEDDAFTRCKSDLKYLDYAALGIPGVFSDVRPYRDTVRHRETGLPRRTPGGVGGRLEEIVADAALRARLAAARRPRCTAAACWDERGALARRDRDDRPRVLRLGLHRSTLRSILGASKMSGVAPSRVSSSARRSVMRLPARDERSTERRRAVSPDTELRSSAKEVADMTLPP